MVAMTIENKKMTEADFDRAVQILPNGNRALKIENVLNKDQLNTLLRFLSKNQDVKELDIKIENNKDTSELLHSYFQSPYAKSLESLELKFSDFFSTPSLVLLAFISAIVSLEPESRRSFESICLCFMAMFIIGEGSKYLLNQERKSNLEGYIQENMNLTYNGVDTVHKRVDTARKQQVGAEKEARAYVNYDDESPLNRSQLDALLYRQAFAAGVGASR